MDIADINELINLINKNYALAYQAQHTNSAMNVANYDKKFNETYIEACQKFNTCFAEARKDPNKKKLIAEQYKIFQHAHQQIALYGKLFMLHSRCQNDIKNYHSDKICIERVFNYVGHNYQELDKKAIKAVFIALAVANNNEEITNMSDIDHKSSFFLKKLKSTLPPHLQARLQTILDDKKNWEASWRLYLFGAVLCLLAMTAIVSTLFIAYSSAFASCAIIMQYLFSACAIYLSGEAYDRLENNMFQLQIDSADQSRENASFAMDSWAFLLGGMLCVLAMAAYIALFIIFPPSSMLAAFFVTTAPFLVALSAMSSCLFNTFYQSQYNIFQLKKSLGEDIVPPPEQDNGVTITIFKYEI